jgi:NAD(P)-dependent dehydrogenase (short-subunit alcohol dehydrogenase family)
VTLIVGGASTEVGRATARALAAAGSHVILADRDGETLARLEGELGAIAPVHALVLASGTNREGCVADALHIGGRLDMLVQHPVTTFRGPAAQITRQAWDADLDLLAETFLIAREFAAQAEAHSSIVHVGSIDVAQAYPGRLTASVFANALVGLSRSLAVEFALKPVRVNVVSPGVMLSAQDEAAIQRGEKTLERVLLRAPSHRLGTAAETAALIGFLLSGRADFITGQAMSADGGWAALTQHAEGLRFP